MLLDQSTIINNIRNFKRSGVGDIDSLGTPGEYFFTLSFLFKNQSESGQEGSSLLYPQWMTSDSEISSDSSSTSNTYNCAYNFLMNNGEHTRKAQLKEFITILNDITEDTPWYWSSISGLTEALQIDPKNIIPDEPKKIIIKTLPDSSDSKIGYMLDLYRNIVWSKTLKKEIIPANLRKFDMGIYIFQAPIQSTYSHDSLHYSMDGQLGGWKYIEFQNCEFDINNCLPIDELTGVGTPLEYNISISFDTCTEMRYNSTRGWVVDDIVYEDIYYTKDTSNYSISEKTRAEQNEDFNIPVKMNSTYEDPGLPDKDKTLYYNRIPGAVETPSNWYDSIVEYGKETWEDTKTLGSLLRFANFLADETISKVVRGNDDLTPSNIYLEDGWSVQSNSGAEDTLGVISTSVGAVKQTLSTFGGLF